MAVTELSESQDGPELEEEARNQRGGDVLNPSSMIDDGNGV
jgi:hypothetical protein